VSKCPTGSGVVVVGMDEKTNTKSGSEGEGEGDRKEEQSDSVPVMEQSDTKLIPRLFRCFRLNWSESSEDTNTQKIKFHCSLANLKTFLSS
jgi:hypothetical protein